MEKNKLPNDYFPHDFNARFDRKILRCRKVLGLEGYGIYWMLIETLCLQENFSYPLKDIDLLADDFGCSVEKVEAVVKQFELFQIDKDAKFFSLSLIARMQKYLELSEKARHSVNVRWEKAKKLKELQQTDTTVLQSYNESNTIKEKDIKEYKIKENNTSNVADEISNLFTKRWSRPYKNLSELQGAEKLVLEFGYDKVNDAFRKAGENGITKIPYVRGILNKDKEKETPKKRFGSSSIMNEMYGDKDGH